MTKDVPGTLLLDPMVIEDPYRFYRRLRMQAPVWRVPDRDVFVVTSFAMVAEAAARVEDFSSNMRSLLYRDEEELPAQLSFGDAGVDVLATADPPLHKTHRGVVFSELVTKRMAQLEPVIADLASCCVDSAVDQVAFDFMADIGNVVPITLVSRLIGFHNEDLDQLRRAAFDSTSLLGASLRLSDLEGFVGRVAEIEHWIAGQLSAAMAAPDDDILGAIARGISAESLSVQQGCVILHTLLSAGGESTASLLGNAVRLLAEHQEVQQELRSHPEQIPAFVEEALRLESPFRSFLRSVPENTTLGGVEIPAGSTVLLFWAAANRDPAIFERPDEIDLDRPAPRRHVAFGRGIHHCVGAPLARLEARVVLDALLARTESIVLDPASPPERVESLMVRRHEHLPIRVIPR